ncbi:MAG: folate-binding protein [Burkholderiales bacterium]
MSNLTSAPSKWLQFLESRGARVAHNSTAGSRVEFGRPEAELRAAQSGRVIAPLTHLATLGFAGADAEAFLQGQLSCDVQGLDSVHAALGCYCTPQGRMLANFVVWRDGDDLRMALSADIAGAIQKRLRMFVLRSKVEISMSNADPVLLGVAGPAGARALNDTIGAAHADPMNLYSNDGATAIRLPGERFLVAVRSQRAIALWEELTSTLGAVGTAAWQWLDIVAGMPLVTGPTQDQFVPQMTNLDLIGGINFHKGCYVGQEVIARAQYRGKVKRRMYLAHIAAATAHAGDRVVGGDDSDSAGGIVVNAAPSPEGGSDVLAVLHSASLGDGTLRLNTPDGPTLELRTLPYGIE